MIPSLRAGRYSREPRVAITWSMHVQQLAGAADRVALDGARSTASRRAVSCQAAVDLADVAEVAHQVEEEVDLPVGRGG